MILEMPYVTYLVLVAFCLHLLGTVPFLIQLHKKDIGNFNKMLNLNLNFSFLLFMATVLSFFMNNSQLWFPFPQQEHLRNGQSKCGLMVPPGHSGNESAQLWASGKWIWVELNQSAPPNQLWEYNKECLSIAKYDVVKSSWAQLCTDWCHAELGSFMWNELCAFGALRGENIKPMKVLRVCQKAVVASFLPFSDFTAWLFAVALFAFGIWLGYQRRNILPGMELVDEIKFETRHEPATITLFGPIGSLSWCFETTRYDKSMYIVLNALFSVVLQFVTGFSQVFLYFIHGQPFFAMYQLWTKTQFSGWDLLCSRFFAWTLWSYDEAIPAYDLVLKTSWTLPLSSAQLIVLMIFLLNAPLRDDDGAYVISTFALLNFGLSTILCYKALYSGAEATRQVQIMKLYNSFVLDLDARFNFFCGDGKSLRKDLINEYIPTSLQISLFAMSMASCRVAFSGTQAILVLAAGNGMISFHEAISLFGSTGIAMSVSAGLVFAILKWRRIPIAKNLLDIPNSLGVGYGAWCAYGYLYLPDVKSYTDTLWNVPGSADGWLLPLLQNFMLGTTYLSAWLAIPATLVVFVLGLSEYICYDADAEANLQQKDDGYMKIDL